MHTRHCVVAVLGVQPGCESAFDAYERKAVAIAAAYGGRMERRIRSQPGPGVAFEEVHVWSFPDEASFAGYRADPALAALGGERASVIASTSLVTGSEQPPLPEVPTPPERLLLDGIDHVYLAVSDLARSEAYYDRVLRALGLHKGNKAVAGERHAHYFAPSFQISLRPARTDRAHDPYAPGLHHLCMQVDSHAALDRVYAILQALGAAPSVPRLYPQYSPDYYATFFDDPDGIRLEVVARTANRERTARRWPEFEGFVNPLADLEGKARGVFHIVDAARWDAAKRAGQYVADSLASEGFIHCSLRAQVVQSANAHFPGQDNLVLLQLDPRKLTAELRYEPPLTLTPEIFPHLYGPLNLDAVVAEYPLELAADGGFALPPALR